MSHSVPVLFLLVIACSTTDGGDATTTTPPPAPRSSLAATTTTEAAVECPPPPYELDFLPSGVGSAVLDPAQIEPDVWTSVPGISATIWGRDDGTVALALARGALPAVDWPAEKGEVSIDGTRAVVGPHLDGTWVAGWFEAPGERCDLYTLVVYPPVSSDEVEQVIDGMNRVGG